MTCRRIAMWSGPRNISTTMMRSFGNRADTVAVDEPLYAHYLTATGITHPMQDEILASQSHDWQHVVDDLTKSVPAPIYFQKHMCHHVTDDMPTDWLGELSHFFLIRDPARMVASYAEKMEKVSADALGLDQELALFEIVSAQTGAAPPVVDALDILADPRGMLEKLCAALDIEFVPEMLNWPAGPHPADGAWAGHWYGNVQDSTGFRPPGPGPQSLPDHLQKVVEESQPAYHTLKAHALI